jgi:hypothetical protein
MMPAEWGTITPSGWLTLDPMLLTLPKELGEFVIVHELVHLLAPTKAREGLQVVPACLYARLGGTRARVAGLYGGEERLAAILGNLWQYS